MAMEIGRFYEQGSTYSGSISTRKLDDLGNVVFHPFDKAGDSEPDFLVKSGRNQIGRAWKQQTQDKEGEYLNVLLDDPHMDEPIRCRLVKYDGLFLLLWERS